MEGTLVCRAAWSLTDIVFQAVQASTKVGEACASQIGHIGPTVLLDFPRATIPSMQTSTEFSGRPEPLPVMRSPSPASLNETLRFAALASTRCVESSHKPCARRAVGSCASCRLLLVYVEKGTLPKSGSTDRRQAASSPPLRQQRLCAVQVFGAHVA